MTSFAHSPLIAVLGPTNTGKTHLAIERLCAHSSGMMGFPLRLLAREVYDRVAKIKGKESVALLTGEEKILPPKARYFLCTAESMPRDGDFAFVAIDEAQLGIDPERGHVFTDRMLHVRGREETMILGSESLRPLIRALLPEAQIITRPRFSTLSFAGTRKLTRLPRRSAIVAFSVEDVYAMAEMIRRHQGGAAIVMGALSPQTRNAQVAMYQAGEVDYLVATDAIGMGLNLDIDAVFFASLKKFDGRRNRMLTRAEIGQIAGRAGRHQRDGQFGLLAGAKGAESCDDAMVKALEEHDYPPLEWLYWRQAEPDVSSVSALITSLEERPVDQRLEAAPEAIDLAILKRLAEQSDIAATRHVALLWELASIPDFRKVGPEHQARFIAGLWHDLRGGTAQLSRARLGQEIARLDNVQGDIGTLAGRIAAARTWSYIAHKAHWTQDSAEFVERARALESRLSDAMHSQLTQRFVDKRTRALLRGLGGALTGVKPDLAADGSVFVDGICIGRLHGFQFAIASDSRREDRKLALQVAERFMGGVMADLAEELVQCADSELVLRAAEADGVPTIFWRDAPVATLAKGRGLLAPECKLVRSVRDLAPDSMEKVRARVNAWIAAMLEKHLGGLLAMQKLAEDANTPATTRALLAQLVTAGGIIARDRMLGELRALEKEERLIARRAGLVYSALDLYHYGMMKPGAALWRAALFAAWQDAPMISLPADNAVHLSSWDGVDGAQAQRMGFRRFGQEFVRIDMVNKLLKQAHDQRALAPVFAADDALPISLGLSLAGHSLLLESAGFARAEPPGPPADVLAIAAEPSASGETPDTSETSEASAAPAGPPSAAADVEPAVAEPQLAESELAELEVAEPELAAVLPSAAATDTADAEAGDAASAPVVEAADADTPPPAENVATDDAAPVKLAPPPRYFRWVGLGKTRHRRPSVPPHRQPHQQQQRQQPQQQHARRPAKGAAPSGAPAFAARSHAASPPSPAAADGPDAASAPANGNTGAKPKQPPQKRAKPTKPLPLPDSGNPFAALAALRDKLGK